MQVSFNIYPYHQNFCSNNRVYHAENGNPISTYTKMFRADLAWEDYTDFMVRHFKDKDKVQILQFAASDGSEAYTQIITLLENHKDTDKFFPIMAYDIDKEIYDVSKSGLLKISESDKTKFKIAKIDFDKYFQKSSCNLFIEDDTSQGETYEVLPILKEKVKFHNDDMFKVLRDHEDEGNTVLLCRNILDYFTDRQIDIFTTIAAYKLKKGSLFVIGEIDRHRVDVYLQQKGFVKVMPGVYVLK